MSLPYPRAKNILIFLHLFFIDWVNSQNLINNATYSVELRKGDYVLVPGHTSTALAFGHFDDSMNETGWTNLFVSSPLTSPGSLDNRTFAAGFLEGALTHHRIFQHYTNFMADYNVSFPLPNSLEEFISANDEWVKNQIKSFGNIDPLWKNVALLYTQMDGIVEGYNSVDSNYTSALNRQQILMLNLQGDLNDILMAIQPERRPRFDLMSSEEIMAYDQSSTHCSALFKLLPDYSELFVGHNMWWGYYSMLPMFKTIRLNGHTVMMPSYPGTIASTDDFYQLSSGLVVIETTIGNYNMSSFDLIKPQTLYYWVRVMAANYMAKNGKEWVDIFSHYNSGTYNNKWMVLDYNIFEPGHLLKPETLWVLEQMPGHIHAEDQTHALSYGYWPSYNRALYPSTVALTNTTAMVEALGPYYSYQLTARAEIFRRDQGTVSREEDMKRLLRYNKFQTDPLAHGNACWQLACRGDLGKTPVSEGATNAKLTSFARQKAGEVVVVAGPTHDDQEPFDWRKVPASISGTSHIGQPDKWEFDWTIMQRN